MSLKKLLIFGIIKEELKEEGVKDPLEELSKESYKFPKESISRIINNNDEVLEW